jgi:hypothetical protein
MAAYLDNDAIKDAVAAALKVDVADIPENFLTAIPAAHQNAVDQLASFAASRGFTAGPPPAWAAGPGFERDQSVYWTLVKGAGLEAYDDRWVEKMNRLKEMMAATITDAAGAVIAPAASDTEVGFGLLDTKSDRLKLSDIKY